MGSNMSSSSGSSYDDPSKSTNYFTSPPFQSSPFHGWRYDGALENLPLQKGLSYEQSNHDHATLVQMQLKTEKNPYHGPVHSTSFLAGTKFTPEIQQAAERTVARYRQSKRDDYCNYGAPGGVGGEIFLRHNSFNLGSEFDGNASISYGVSGHTSVRFRDAHDGRYHNWELELHDSSMLSRLIPALNLEKRMGGGLNSEAGFGLSVARREPTEEYSRYLEALDLQVDTRIATTLKADVTMVKNWRGGSKTTARLDVIVPTEALESSTAVLSATHEQRLNKHVKIGVSASNCSVNAKGNVSGPGVGVTVKRNDL